MMFFVNIRKAISNMSNRAGVGLGVRQIATTPEDQLDRMAEIIEGGTASTTDEEVAEVDPILAFKVAAYYYACVHAIISRVARVPMIVRGTTDQSVMTSDNFLNDFLRVPGKIADQHVYWKRFVNRWLLNHKVFGASYFQLLAKQEGGENYVGLHVLKRPDKMEYQDNGTYKLSIGNFEHTYAQEEIRYLSIESPDSDEDVHGPAESLASTLSLYIQSRKYNQGVFKNGAQPGGIIKFDHQLRQLQYNRLMTHLQNMANYPGRWLVLDSEGADLLTGKDLQSGTINEVAYRGLGEDLKNEIMAVSGAQPIMIGDTENLTYHNASLQLKAFWTGEGTDLIETLAQFINVEVLPAFGYDNQKLEIWYDEEWVKEQYRDEELEHTKLKDDLDAGAISYNEYRRIRGYDDAPSEEANWQWIPQGRVPLSTSQMTAMNETEEESSRDTGIADSSGEVGGDENASGDVDRIAGSEAVENQRPKEDESE